MSVAAELILADLFKYYAASQARDRALIVFAGFAYTSRYTRSPNFRSCRRIV